MTDSKGSHRGVSPQRDSEEGLDAGPTGAPFSVGVEEEYQLVDPTSGGLRSRAPEVLDSDWAGELQAEMQQTMLEVGTPICGSAAELRAEIARLRFQAATTAAANGLVLVAAGLHPDDAWERQRRSPGERYARLAERLGRLARTDHIFGMHVHVAVDPAVDRLRLIAAIRGYLPHLIALAGSSPIYAGEDTRFSSYRTVLAGRLPNSGMPPALESEDEYERMLQVALAAGVLPDRASLYWSLRPHSRYPTLEFRAGDVCPRVEDAAAIAALARALVAAAVQGKLRHVDGGFGSGAMDGLLRANEWQAARYGLGARLAAPGRSPRGETVHDGVLRLLDEVSPVAEQLGDHEMLAGVERILARGNGADRIRQAFAADPSLPGLMRWLSDETMLGTGMDRRGGQRTPAEEPAGR